MRRPAVFLDRDGVINAFVHNPEFGTIDSPATPDEFTLLAGVPDAVATLNRMGFPVVVVSNQPGIAKGRFSQVLLDATTRRMVELLLEGGASLDGIYYCCHHPEGYLPQYRGQCACRKPKPGLLLKAANDMNIDLARSYMVGDGTVDLIAGRTAGATTIFVSSRKCYVCDELARQEVEPDYIVSGLPEAVQTISAVEHNDHQWLKKVMFPRECVTKEPL